MLWLERNNILKELKHPNIIKLYDSFQDPKNLYFVLEWAPNGTLTDYIERKGKFPYDLARFYATELLSAIGMSIN